MISRKTYGRAQHKLPLLCIKHDFFSSILYCSTKISLHLRISYRSSSGIDTSPAVFSCFATMTFGSTFWKSLSNGFLVTGMFSMLCFLNRKFFSTVARFKSYNEGIYQHLQKNLFSKTPTFQVIVNKRTCGRFGSQRWICIIMCSVMYGGWRSFAKIE